MHPPPPPQSALEADGGDGARAMSRRGVEEDKPRKGSWPSSIVTYGDSTPALIKYLTHPRGRSPIRHNFVRIVITGWIGLRSRNEGIRGTLSGQGGVGGEGRGGGGSFPSTIPAGKLELVPFRSVRHPPGGSDFLYARAVSIPNFLKTFPGIVRT